MWTGSFLKHPLSVSVFDSAVGGRRCRSDFEYICQTSAYWYFRSTSARRSRRRVCHEHTSASARALPRLTRIASAVHGACCCILHAGPLTNCSGRSSHPASASVQSNISVIRGVHNHSIGLVRCRIRQLGLLEVCQYGPGRALRRDVRRSMTSPVAASNRIMPGLGT